VVHTSIGGDQLRLRLTNEFGEQPLHIGEVRVAHRAGTTGTDIDPATDRQVEFGGRASVTVPAGTPLVSDPVALRLPARTDLVVSIYLPETTPVTTVHAFSYQENVLSEGNVTADRSVTATEKLTQWYFLSGVSVRAHGRHAEAVVALDDSITDGSETTLNANHRWPDVLAQRLRGVGVLNSGIAGNRLLQTRTRHRAARPRTSNACGQSTTVVITCIPTTRGWPPWLRPSRCACSAEVRGTRGRSPAGMGVVAFRWAEVAGFQATGVDDDLLNHHSGIDLVYRD
jgi:hypothetical protein